MSKKSILEQALLQVQDLEEAVKANAKGILASTMKEELNEVLNESMEQEEVELSTKEDEQDMPISEQGIDDEEGNDDETSINDDDTDKVDPDMEDEEGEDESDDELSIDDEDEDFSLPMDSEGEGEDEVLDMTDASDDEVLKVFKSMKPEDGIVVKRDGDNVELEDGDDEYIIKLDDEESEVEKIESEDDEMGLPEMGDDMEDEEGEVSETDDTIYEVELEDVSEESEEEVSDKEVSEEEIDESEGSDEEMEEEVSEEEESHEEEVDEAARTKSNAHGGVRTGLKSKKLFKAGSKAINEEVETLKKQNGEYKKALVMFKEKLNEVAVFNANLAYATRLFTEHSTTRKEKLNILKRFDSVSSLTESKSTYKVIEGELGSKQNVTESVAKAIVSTPTSSSSQEVLSETKAYESPQFKRMKDLMSKL
tara:strand:- start:77 stop:1348 length:1272 start_codon:yes stop_codon:yes gene_type:complete